MRKRNLVVGAGTVTAGALVFTNLLRGPGDAAMPSSPRVISVTVVDRCGELVREADGRPMVLQFRVDPPPLEGTVADESGVELPATEGIQVGTLLRADPRMPTDGAVTCL